MVTCPFVVRVAKAIASSLLKLLSYCTVRQLAGGVKKELKNGTNGVRSCNHAGKKMKDAHGKKRLLKIRDQQSAKRKIHHGGNEGTEEKKDRLKDNNKTSHSRGKSCR